MAKFIKKDGRNVGDVKLYALSTCGWCRKTKEFLDDSGIAYSYEDVDLLPEDEMEQAVEEQRKYNASGSFPTIVVNGEKVIVGYDLEALEQLVKAG